MQITPDPVVQLAVHAQYDPQFKALLEASLTQAKALGEAQLDGALFDVIGNLDGRNIGWPTTLQGYMAFLEAFARWRPRQSEYPGWANPADGQSQEVYDRLCHFYWLIDQKIGSGKPKVVQNIPWFSQWLVEYARYWGAFLDTPASFDQEILDSFIDTPNFDVRDSMIEGPDGWRPNAPSGWLTFNQFFARELNPGVRPISAATDNTTLTAPADCTLRKMYDIGPDGSVPNITIKQTHVFGTVQALLDHDDKYADAFNGGTFAHYFLGPYSYHRFHTPVAGAVKRCRAVQGLVYLAVDIDAKTGQFDAPDNADDGYEFAQARGILIIDTTGSPYGDIGLVGIVPVGMCQVSSVNMIHSATEGTNQCAKGDEFGYFLFGGSDIIVLLQEGAAKKIDCGGEYRLYGTPIASCNLRR